MQKVEISLKTVLLFFLVPVFLLTLWEIRGILIALIVSVILMSAIAPLVDSFEKRTKLPKILAMVLIYLTVFLTLGFIIWRVVPPLFDQTNELFKTLPFLIGKAIKILGITGEEAEVKAFTQTVINFFESQLTQSLGNLVQITIDIFSGVLTFLTVAVFSFYLLLERERVKDNLYLFFPHLPKGGVDRLTQRIEEKLGAWLRGQILLSLIIGIMTWVGLTLLGVNYALPLAIIAGVLEVVPIIGPIISAIPALVVALVVDPFLTVGVAALYLLVQQLENNLIVPKVMEKAVGMSPLLVILSLLIGGEIFGIFGALLAVPVTAAIVVVWQDWHESQLTKEK